MRDVCFGSCILNACSFEVILWFLLGCTYDSLQGYVVGVESVPAAFTMGTGTPHSLTLKSP